MRPAAVSLLREMVRRQPEGAQLMEWAMLLGMPRPTLAHEFRALQRAGYLDAERVPSHKAHTVYSVSRKGRKVAAG